MVSTDLEENDVTIVADKSENLSDGKKCLRFKRKLIFQVRKHRLLYDNKHKLFSNVAKKELVWQQIAKELKVNADDCKDIWLELRYAYQHHVRRLHKYFMNGHKENRKRPAMYMESELMFLWRFIENRKTCKLQFEISEINAPPAIEIEPDPVTEPECESQKEVITAPEITAKQITPITNEKEVEKVINNKQNCSNTSTQKTTTDDDLILVEQPVELIVIDEDDENNKNEKQFKVSSSMKLLIAQIKAYPELYDSENLAFKDYTRKSYIWNAIACNLSDKATKLMKCWIMLQTRYEWEICQTKQNSNKSASPPPTTSELQVELEFLKNYILNNPDTVYKQSYYLKTAWYDPIDYFKDIYNLIVRMKKNPDIVYITDSLLKTPEKSKQYLTLWSDIALLKGSTAGQCETTWLIMRHFYWELMYMRQQNYQLTDKWYFESIITELYAISKAAQTAKQQELKVLKQKPLKKVNKRPAQTSAITLGAPSATRAVTTTQMTPTIVNNLPSVPASNTTLTTPSISGQQPITFPKITAAISLAPQSLNTGSLQIKPIPGPPNLSPAPQPSHNLLNGAVMTSSGSAGAAPMSMSFNLPTQTKVTSVPMPPLIRTVAPPTTTQPIIRNTSQAQITVRPRAVLRPVGPNIQIKPLTTTAGPTINTFGNPQTIVNIPASIVSNSNTTVPTLAQNQSQQQSISSFKITTLPSSNTTANVLAPTTASPAATSNNTQLPKISSAISLLNPNEILIELIASQNGNQLVVHGPPLSAKYQLSMPTVAKFIREVLAIPLLHNKRNIQPTLINMYWEHIGRKFNLPVHICRACWNFLLENFNHFPQIAPLKELMRPFQTSLNVWKESSELFKKFDEHCVSKGWLKYVQFLPEVMECIGGYPALYQDVSKQSNPERLSDMEKLCVWRTISLRFPKIPEIQEIWSSIKACFCQYMNDLEFGIDNKWPINWWRSLARLKFLVEAKYTTNEPFYYIISNKMLEEIEKCAMLEMKNRYKNDSEEKKVSDEKLKKELENQTKTNDIVSSKMASKGRKDIELGALITAIQKCPVILNTSDSLAKYEAWKKVANGLNMEVTDCLLSFKEAIKMYFAYKKKDPISRCRLNERYYKKLDEIVRYVMPSKYSIGRGKLNIKTPLELNQSLDTNSSSNGSELVFPERFISDISMTSNPSNLVVKNWVYAIGNVGFNGNDNNHLKLKTILSKYLSTE